MHETFELIFKNVPFGQTQTMAHKLRSSIANVDSYFTWDAFLKIKPLIS